jgi:hypothetical protein
MKACQLTRTKFQQKKKKKKKKPHLTSSHFTQDAIFMNVMNSHLQSFSEQT